MKGIFTCALGLAVAASTFGATITISTGTGNAAWQVQGPGTGFATVAAVSVTPSAQTGVSAPPWVAAPTGTSWVSFDSFEATNCNSAATGPANGCSSANFTSQDVYTYTLTISAAALGATSGTVNFAFASDNRVNLFIGGSSIFNNGGFGPNGTGYLALANGTYNFTAADLNGTGGLTLTAYDYNDPVVGCPSCGNPSGFLVSGSITTGGVSTTPEPATFGLVSLAGLVGGIVLRRKRS